MHDCACEIASQSSIYIVRRLATYHDFNRIDTYLLRPDLKLDRFIKPAFRFKTGQPDLKRYKSVKFMLTRLRCRAKFACMHAYNYWNHLPN